MSDQVFWQMLPLFGDLVTACWIKGRWPFFYCAFSVFYSVFLYNVNKVYLFPRNAAMEPF